MWKKLYLTQGLRTWEREYYQKGKETGDKLAEDLSNIDWNTKQAEASQKGKEAAEKLNRAISGLQ